MDAQELAFPALTSAITPDATFMPDFPDLTARPISCRDEQSKGTKRTKSSPKTDTALSTDLLAPISVIEGGISGEDLKPPGLSYIALISMAIQSSKNKRMLLSDIYSWISERYPYYRLKDKSWRNSIRHNLSLNECFVKSGRSENGKGNYWSIHPANMEDFSQGDYRRRRARRRVRKCDEDLQRLCSDEPETEEIEPPLPPPTTHAEGYVPMASTLVPANFLSVLGIEPIKSFDYLVQGMYRHGDAQFRTPLTSAYECQDPTCVTTTKDYNNYTDNNFQRSYFPHFTRYGDGVAPFTPTEFNLNVNVNVCGNGSQQLMTPGQASSVVTSDTGTWHSGAETDC
ncbi:forkhead box protein B1-like [Mya arenaria]|uniref:forkhead box protein B1-like n=1 Tax=Mya arenaria TaxID=6604 RepID=UPI0022E9738D|nr:forkhead box protein B1-like [Mya arenaria]